MENGHGGKRDNSGRKSKSDELELVSTLSAFDNRWLDAMEKGLIRGEYTFCKLFADYRFGKPKERIDHTTNGKDIQTVIQIVRPDDSI